MDSATEAEAALAERIRLGDPAAEEELIRAFASRILAMAVSRTRDRDASRDLVQDVLCAVLLSLRAGQLREADKLAAFVCGTARNLINNHLRSRSRHPHEVPLPPDLVVVDVLEEDRELAGIVERAIADLEPGDRQILLLTLVSGLKPGEIARQLRLSSDVVRQRKSRAIKRIVDILGRRSRT